MFDEQTREERGLLPERESDYDTLDVILGIGSIFDWPGALIGMWIDELRDGRAITCSSISQAYHLRDFLRTRGIRCYVGIGDAEPLRPNPRCNLRVIGRDVERAIIVLGELAQ
jgi:hypothetical protein